MRSAHFWVSSGMVWLLGQACGGDSGADGPPFPQAGGGPSVGGSAAGGMSGGGVPSGGSGDGGAATVGGRVGAGGFVSTMGGQALSGGSANGGITSETGGDSAGGSASGGSSASGGNSGDGGGLNEGGPCPVPSFIGADPTAIGWASEGSKTSGGGNATPILVTSLSELKSQVSGSAAKVLYVKGEFAPDDITIGANKTLIGCSPGATLKGHIQIGSGSSNIILRNLNVTGYGAGDCSLDPSFNSSEGCSSGADAISVNGSAHHVWIDHTTIMDGTDGNLDITNDADFVTVSWSKFAYTPRTDNVGSDSTGSSGHRYSNLVGGTDSKPTNWPSTVPLNVTWHHNWWADNVVERQPRVRYGRNHLFNNYYNSDASNYCVRAGIEASVLLAP
jgi:pectate lyase